MITREEKKALEDFDRIVCKLMKWDETSDTWFGRIRARWLLWKYLRCEDNLRKVYEKQAKILWNSKIRK